MTSLDLRPQAVPETVTFADLRPGDFITADDEHWVRVKTVDPVVPGDGSPAYKSTPGDLRVTFATREPVGSGAGHTDWVIYRPPATPVVRDTRTESV